MVAAGADMLIVHARKAWLNGLSPKENRDIPPLDYDLLWHERSIRSVANLTRRDAEEFLGIAPRVPIHTHVTTYPLAAANQALDDLRHGRFTGAAVLAIPS